MNRKTIQILVVILLIVIFSVASVAVIQAWNNLPSKVIGTYAMDNVNPTQNVYLSFFNDGRFQVFNPSRELYSGKYQEDSGMITDDQYIYLTLHLEDGTRTYAIFDRHDRVILDRSAMPNLPEQLRPFIRITDTPALFTNKYPE